MDLHLIVHCFRSIRHGIIFLVSVLLYSFLLFGNTVNGFLYVRLVHCDLAKLTYRVLGRFLGVPYEAFLSPATRGCFLPASFATFFPLLVLLLCWELPGLFE